MASVWIRTRTTKDGGRRYRVEYRPGGRDATTRFAGSFATKRLATIRAAAVEHDLAALRIPELHPERVESIVPTLRAEAERWQASRVDVADATTVQHRTALNRLLAVLGARRIDAITPADVTDLHADGKARESIRKSLTALAMVLDFAGVDPNPARDRIVVKLPREEPVEPNPPTADHSPAP